MMMTQAKTGNAPEQGAERSEAEIRHSLALKMNEDQGDLRLAAAVLLVNAALADGHVDTAEHEQMLDDLMEQFGLSHEEAVELLEQALKQTDPEKLLDELKLTPDEINTTHEAGSLREKLAKAREKGLYGAAQKLLEKLEQDERRVLVAMVHNIVYADGMLDPEEARLLNGMGGLLNMQGFDQANIRSKIRDLLRLKEHQAQKDYSVEQTLAQRNTADPNMQHRKKPQPN